MSTLLMRLAAPLQSWGLESKFDTRRTGWEPSKSGVIGLVAAALGIRRDDAEALSGLAAMRFGVRVDREGVMIRDYHTAKSENAAYVTQRYYLADAVFVAGLESDDEERLRQIEKALASPAFPLYLGRRSCPPSGKICMGVFPVPLEEALQAIPCQCERTDGAMRVVMDAKPGTGGGMVRDVPVSYNPEKRQYAFRQVTEKGIHIGVPETADDPMSELE